MALEIHSLEGKNKNIFEIFFEFYWGKKSELDPKPKDPTIFSLIILCLRVSGFQGPGP